MRPHPLPASRPDTRTRLLDAARTLFSEQGYAETSTRRIAASAGCNLALISHYFGSKEGLLRSVIGEGMREVGRELRSIASSDLPPEQRIGRAIDFLVDHSDRNCRGMQVVHRELMQADRPTLEELRPLIADNFEAIVSMLERAKREGALREVDPRVAALMLTGMLQFYFVAYAMTAHVVGERSPAMIASIKKHIAEIFLHGAGSAATCPVQVRLEDIP